ncbi:MAG: hypothetical protein ACYCSP_05945 [Acidobacteriaceae bacterium]
MTATTGWTAQITGADTLAPEMRGAVEEGTQKGLERLGSKCAEMVQKYIGTPYNGKPPAVAFGFLQQSITATQVREATMIREVIGVAPTLGADVYAAPVETGTRPHMPPPSALVPWVQKKFGIEDEKQALGLAFAIAKTIAKRGTQGHEMFSRALADIEPMAPAVLEQAISQALLDYGFAL